MQLDRTRIAIRERGFLEIMDLALSVIRGHAWPVFVAWLLMALPLGAFNYWLLNGKLLDTEFEFDDPVGWGYVWQLLILMAAEIPLATALITLYLGQALFEERPTAGQVWRQFWNRFGQMFWVQGVLRGGGAMLAILLYVMDVEPALIGLIEFFLVMFWLLLWVIWPYLNEVLLLERNPLRKAHGGTSTLGRTLSMHSYAAADLIARWLVSATFGSLLVVALWMSMLTLRQYIAFEEGIDNAAFTIFLPIAVWIVMGYFAVVRFLSYLDLRIRSEGWEVELMMRAEGARLTRQLA